MIVAIIVGYLLVATLIFAFIFDADDWGASVGLSLLWPPLVGGFVAAMIIYLPSELIKNVSSLWRNRRWWVRFDD